MNYAEQRSFLNSNSAAGSVVYLGLLLQTRLTGLHHIPRSLILIYFVVVLATAASLIYTPSYLHLTVYPNKRWRWAVRVRWPILAAALALALPFCHSPRSFIALLVAIAFLVLTNFVLSRTAHPHATLLLSGIDCLVLFALLAFGKLNLLIAGALFGAAVHLFVVATKKRPFSAAVLASVAAISAGITGLALQLAPTTPPSTVVGVEAQYIPALVLPILITAFGTAFLVHRAEEQNSLNLIPVMIDLEEFTGYTPEIIRQKMATADAELAAKWKAAAIPEDDADRMAAWYQQNSELYLFALVSFNLDYKRIRYFLKIFPLADGSCLDYGAGNGELLLELARRGHSATYYDVDGLTMKYARHRALAENLNIQFFSNKQDLAGAAKAAGFDTIFSLDVLEHLPDLPGELTFLSSLLSRAGKLIFNLPPGSTKSHPMHLTHNLEPRAFLTAKGLKEQKSSRISKDKMYIFTR